MEILTLVIFIATCISVVIFNLKMKDGALRAPAVLSLIALFSFGTMMIQTIINPFFDKRVLPLFFLFISSCLICFHFGFKRGESVEMENIWVREIKCNKNLITSTVFCVFGVIALYAYQGKISGFDWVVAGFLQSFGIISIFLSLNEIKNNRFGNSKYYVLILMIASWCIFDYAFNIKGSRTRIFYIIAFFSLYLSRTIPLKSKIICKSLVVILIFGSIAGFSMGDYRSEIDKPFVERISTEQIVKNLKVNLTGQGKVSINGQDLYNGARYADYSLRNFSYNYGTFIWNGLVFNYVPQRFVGEDIKDNMMCSLENREVVKQLTKSVTTVTGFGDAFAAFSIFGCVIFYIIAYFLGKWWTLSFYSDFYLLLYAYAIMYIAPMATHGITYFVSPMVFFWLIIFPLLRHSIYFVKYE